MNSIHLKNGKKHSWKRVVGSSFSLFAAAFIIFSFQNCVSGGGGVGDTGSTGTPDPTPPATCPFNSNSTPTMSNFSSLATTFRVGMGATEGTEGPKTLTASFNSGDNNSGVVDVRCAIVNNAGLNVTCDDPTSPAKSGTTNIRITAANGAECSSGTVTINVSVQDVMLSAQNTAITACNNLNRTSSLTPIVVNVTSGCRPTQRLNPTTPTMTGQMGNSVSIDDDWAVSAAPGDDEKAANAGAAYVMRRVGTTWSIVQKLMPATLAAGDSLTNVKISGDFIVLGAPLANSSAGTAWIYQFNGTNWVEVKTLTPPAGGGGLFGAALAISGTNIAAGAPRANVNALGVNTGAVHVYSGTNWNTVTTLLPSGSTILGGRFGSSLAYSGNTLAVGAPFPAVVAARLESVYIFDNLALSKKISNAANAEHRFGQAIALDGNNLLVGAPFHTNNRGIAYLYTRATTFPDTATRSYVLADPNNMDKDYFGYSVAIKGTRVVVSAPDKAEGAPKFGAVYLFGTANNTQVLKLRSGPTDRDADSFGYSVDVSSDGWVMSGALNDDQAGVDNSGAVYMISVP